MKSFELVLLNDGPHHGLTLPVECGTNIITGEELHPNFFGKYSRSTRRTKLQVDVATRYSLAVFIYEKVAVSNSPVIVTKKQVRGGLDGFSRHSSQLMNW